MSRRLRVLGFSLLAAWASWAAAAGSAPGVRAAEYQRVAAESYVAVARDALEKSRSGSSADMEMEPIGAYRELRLPAGSLQMRARATRSASRSRAIVWVDLFVEGQLRASRPVGFTLHNWEQVLVAKERLAAKAVLDERQFELRTTDVAAIEGAGVKDVGALAGKRLRRELRAGAVLSVRDLQDLPAVQSGGRISIYARVGRVVVRTAAVAQRDGFAGDVIDARVPDSGENLRVRVTGSNTAWISDNETPSVF